MRISKIYIDDKEITTYRIKDSSDDLEDYKRCTYIHLTFGPCVNMFYLNEGPVCDLCNKVICLYHRQRVCNKIHYCMDCYKNGIDIRLKLLEDFLCTDVISIVRTFFPVYDKNFLFIE